VFNRIHCCICRCYYFKYKSQQKPHIAHVSAVDIAVKNNRNFTVAIFLTTVTIIIVGKGIKRNAFPVEDSLSKKAKSEKEIVYRRKDKIYTRLDISKMILETIHGT
jgi:hypothetical protein